MERLRLYGDISLPWNFFPLSTLYIIYILSYQITTLDYVLVKLRNRFYLHPELSIYVSYLCNNRHRALIISGNSV